jgi:hypothetical protein
MSDDVDLRVISLGAGVQSSTLALMSAAGEIEGQIDFAIFSDTMAEPAVVYAWLEWLEAQLPFPVVRVSQGNLETEQLYLRKHQTKPGHYARALIPAFVRAPDGGRGLLGRRCTRDFKVNPLQRELKLRLGGRKRGTRHSESWLGITTDEAHRMKPSQDSVAVNRWPLIDLGMSRQDCLDWMKDNGFPRPPRSSCYFCPFHSDAEWKRIRNEEPEEFLRAQEFETALQRINLATTVEGAKLLGTPFLHSSCVPLAEASFDGDGQLNLFGNECEGMCGV